MREPNPKGTVNRKCANLRGLETVVKARAFVGHYTNLLKHDILANRGTRAI